LVGAFVLDGPATNDERAYLLQAEMFSEGRLSEPLPPHADAFFRRQIMQDGERGIRYSKYAPGTAAALTPGTWLGAPWLSVALAGILDLLLVVAIARKLGLQFPAGLLLVSSPVFWVMQSSFQSEVFTLPLALMGYYALLRIQSGCSAQRWGLLIGTCAGLMLLCRPLTAVVFAVALAFGLRKSIKGLVWAAISGLALTLLFLAYNAALTGDAWQTTYAAYAAAFQPLDQFGTGDPLMALQTVAAKWFFGFAGVAGVVLLGFAGLAKIRKQDGGAGLALLIALPLVYAFHWYPGHWAYLGPIYVYETMGLLVLGVACVLQRWPSHHRDTALVVLVFGGLLIAFSHYPVLAQQGAQRAAPQLAVADAMTAGTIESAPVVFVTDMKKHTPSRPQFDALGRLSFDEREPVFLRPTFSSTTERVQLLSELGLSGRPVYLFAGTLQRMR
jgi:hypothetical protein